MGCSCNSKAGYTTNNAENLLLETILILNLHNSDFRNLFNMINYYLSMHTNNKYIKYKNISFENYEKLIKCYILKATNVNKDKIENSTYSESVEKYNFIKTNKEHNKSYLFKNKFVSKKHNNQNKITSNNCFSNLTDSEIEKISKQFDPLKKAIIPNYFDEDIDNNNNSFNSFLMYFIIWILGLFNKDSKILFYITEIFNYFNKTLTVINFIEFINKYLSIHLIDIINNYYNFIINNYNKYLKQNKNISIFSNIFSSKSVKCNILLQINGYSIISDSFIAELNELKEKYFNVNNKNILLNKIKEDVLNKLKEAKLNHIYSIKNNLNTLCNISRSLVEESFITNTNNISDNENENENNGKKNYTKNSIDNKLNDININQNNLQNNIDLASLDNQILDTNVLEYIFSKYSFILDTLNLRATLIQNIDMFK